MPYRQFPSSNLRLTTRGWATVLVVFASIGLAWLFGARALNAVAVPAVAVLATGVAQVLLSTDPTVERTPPTPGFPGDSRSVTLNVDGGSTVVDVAETTPGTLVAADTEQTVAPPGEMTYTLSYRPSVGPDDRLYTARGVYELGPTTVTVRDVFGLVRRDVDCGETDEAVVYPQVYSLGDSDVLSSLLGRARTPDREEFDDIREYAPGDPLRDIHWKSSAKRDGDLIVKEFAGREPEGSVTVAVSVSTGQEDQTAAAVATVAVALLEAGVSVTVALPETRLQVDESERSTLFRALAELESGSVDSEQWQNADVTVAAIRGSTTVTVGTRSLDFDRLRQPSGGRTPGDALGSTEVTAS